MNYDKTRQKKADYISDDEEFGQIKMAKVPGNKGKLRVVLLPKAEILTHF